MMIAEYIFWIGIVIILYSYILYPILLFVFSFFIKKKFKSEVYVPSVSIVMAVRNEEKVLEEKIESILNQNFDTTNIEIIIGSDASTDNTNSILKKYSSFHSNIIVKEFDQRQGKPAIINQLIALSKYEIVVLTDANVFFEKNMLAELLKHFSDERIGLVGANVINSSLQSSGIAKEESSYIQLENKIKLLEGNIFGKMMGAFGACYAIRKNLYQKIPPNFIVDDFFLCMNILQNKYGVLAPTAICTEDVSDDIEQEFKRKRRISKGNFQNLFHFGAKVLNPFSSIGFCFISHKLIRWLTPFIYILILASNILLSQNHFYLIVLGLQLIVVFIVIFDSQLVKNKVHTSWLRFITYFYQMNLALLLGFIDYLKGNKSNVWEPTKRN
jgi:cellulose synthase/poly-beta-1,6-N-acetylglucosamine synthase-like glycosyltransferase